jgi:hypothetical protein
MGGNGSLSEMQDWRERDANLLRGPRTASGSCMVWLVEVVSGKDRLKKETGTLFIE